MKLGKQQGCYFDDRIDCNLSPNELTNLIALTQGEAMNTTNYNSQGLWRELKDYLQRRFDEWRAARDKKDKED